MTVSYEMKASDYWSLARYVYTHDRRQRVLLFCAVLVLPTFTLLASLGDPALARSSAWIGAAIVLPIWAVVLYAVLRYMTWSRYRAYPAGMSRIEMTLTDDGVHVTSSITEGVVAWDGLIRIAEDRRAVFIFLSRRMAYTVPARAFGTEAERAEFVAFAASHIESKA